MSDPTRHAVARGAIVDEVRSQLQDAAVGAVDDYIFGLAEATGGSLASIARARAVFGRVMGAWGLLETARDILLAGHSSMTVRRRQVATIAAAHAFGYWMFDYRIASRPETPRLMYDGWLSEDGRGNLDRVTASTFRHTWAKSVDKTLRTLRHRANAQQISTVRHELRLRLPRAAIHELSDREAREMLKVALGAEFNQSPRAAASAFFLTSIAEESMMESSVLIRMYRRYPYTPR